MPPKTGSERVMPPKKMVLVVSCHQRLFFTEYHATEDTGSESIVPEDSGSGSEMPPEILVYGVLCHQ